MSEGMRLALLLLLCAAVCVRVGCIDNGIGQRPPRGWRSWNVFPCEDSSNTTLSGGDIIDDDAMRAQMHAVLDRSRVLHNGSAVSLAELGFDYISMDDGWQQCNCSTHQDMDPTLPTCGQNGAPQVMSFHDPVTGDPVVNLHRFPAMKALVDYGHSLGLKVGTYLNNCVRTSHGYSPPRGCPELSILCPTAHSIRGPSSSCLATSASCPHVRLCRYAWKIREQPTTSRMWHGCMRWGLVRMPSRLF